MIGLLMLTSLVIAPLEALPGAWQGPPVKVWLNKKNEVRRGDRVRVYGRIEADGYLLVLHAEPDGRIRVLLPLDPLDDNFVRGGEDFEIAGRGDREAFRVYEYSGVGTVYAAYSRDPFRFDAFVRGDHWDYRLFESWRVTEDRDPEAELTALVQEMAGATPFSYDLVQYGVGTRAVTTAQYYDTWYPGTAYYGFNLNLGWGWNPWYWGMSYGWPYYDPWNSWYWGMSYGWRHYDPWWSGYWWDPYYGYWPTYRPYYYYPGSYYHYPRYYNDWWYWGGYYGHAGTVVRGKYTFKTGDRTLATGGITARRRSDNAGTLRSSLSQTASARMSGRRLAPTGTVLPASGAGRRTAPATTPATTGGRRAAPAATPSTGRRPAAAPSTPERRVRPDGWGMTDGRRTIKPAERAPAEPSAETPAVQGEQGRRGAPKADTKDVPSTPRTPSLERRSGSPTAEGARDAATRPQTQGTERRPVRDTDVPRSVVPSRQGSERPAAPSSGAERRPSSSAPAPRASQPSAAPRASSPSPRSAAPASRPSSGSSRPSSPPSRSSGSGRRPGG